MQPSNLSIFVYGTLLRDCASGAHRQYLQGATFIAKAKTRGQLFLIDYYPGFRPANPALIAEQDLWVQGEVYLLKDAQQLQQLDRYEGCSHDAPQPHEYTRNLIEVVLATGETVTLWTYIYNSDPSPLAAITSGNFLQR